MKKISPRQAIMLHEILIEKTGGSDGIRDEGMLESALNSPFQTFGGENLYKGIDEKAARLCYSLINDHPFIDGNKRIGVLVMLVFLKINGIHIDFTDEELSALGWGAADGSISYERILEILSEKIRNLRAKQ